MIFIVLFCFNSYVLKLHIENLFTYQKLKFNIFFESKNIRSFTFDQKYYQKKLNEHCKIVFNINWNYVLLEFGENENYCLPVLYKVFDAVYLRAIHAIWAFGPYMLFGFNVTPSFTPTAIIRLQLFVNIHSCIHCYILCLSSDSKRNILKSSRIKKDV